MPLLDNSRLISKGSMWVMNIIIGLIMLTMIAQISTVVRLYKPLEPIEHVNGMKSWSTSVSLEVFKHTLKKSLECEQNNEFSCQTSLYLTLKKPEVNRMKEELNAGTFKIRKLTNQEVAAEIDDSPSPVRLKFTNENDHGFITTIFVLCYYLCFALLLIWCWTLRKIINNIAQGQFFQRDNVRNFLILSIPLIALPFFQIIIEDISRLYFLEHFQVMNGGLSMTGTFNFWPIIFGLIFLIMAGVIKEGMKIKEEQDLTI